MSKKKKIAVVVLAVVFALAAGILVFAMTKFSKIQKGEVDEGKLEISEEAEQEIGDGYLNVAVFGVNGEDPKKISGDADAVYVASLNKETKEIKLFSVYGNTMLKYKGKDIKMKEAYADGGAEKAIAVLNENLELNIKNYVSVNFRAMADAIDALGGIEIDVTEEEIPHINGYDQGIAQMLGREAKVIEAPGKQLLDGAQAAGYCRIRVTDGGDVKRAGRQTAVLDQMIGKLKESGFSQINKVMDAVLPQVETNFDNDELIAYGKDAADYKLTIIPAFPREIKAQERQEPKQDVQFTDYEEVVEGTALEKDVKDLHKELFAEEP